MKKNNYFRCTGASLKCSLLFFFFFFLKGLWSIWAFRVSHPLNSVAVKLLSYMSVRKESIFYAVNGGKHDIITVFNKFDGCEF